MSNILKILALPILLTSSLSQAIEYQARIRMDGVFQEPQGPEVWNTYEPLYSNVELSGTPFACKTWNPARETITLNTVFTQTSNDCMQAQTRTVQNREISSRTNQIRNSGAPFQDSSLSENKTLTRDSKGTKGGSLLIVKPVGNTIAGTNGIYEITSASGTNFNAYVNMTDNGGNWILLARFVTAPNVTLTGNQVIVKDKAVGSYTNDAARYPVIKSGEKNTSIEVMYKGENAKWNSMYGEFQSFSTFPSTTTSVPVSGFSVNTPIGAKTLFLQGQGWNDSSLTFPFGLWTTYGPNGSCGGVGRSVAVADKICPSIYTVIPHSHFDAVSLKTFYLKANNQ